MAAMPGLKERAKTLVELIDGAQLHLGATGRSRSTTRPAALLTPEARDAARRDRCRACEAVEPLDRARRPKQAVRGFAERAGVKLGAVAQPLRAALTGRTTSPRHFRRAGRAGQRGKPGPAARPGRGLTRLLTLTQASACPPHLAVHNWMGYPI